jgi:hypothetical protein
MAEGATVLRAGLALQLQPFGGVVRLVDKLAAWQRRVVYWGYGGVRVTLLSEVANSWCWWGMRDVCRLRWTRRGSWGARRGGRRGSLWGGLSACGDDGGGGECGFFFLR